MIDAVNTPAKFVVACFFVTWIVLGFVGYLAARRKDTAFKRKWFPRYVILAGVLFVFFPTVISFLQSRSWGAVLGILFLFIPAVSVISYLNIRFTKFCDKCGAAIYAYNWFSPIKFCSRCGAALDPKPKLDVDALE
jgi:drug/metabolite transporter (DMT)-like permease